MTAIFGLKQLQKHRSALRADGLEHLHFRDALNDCFALSELAMDMVEAFSSRDELIWIQNGFKPTRKTRNATARRSHGRS